MLVTAHNTLFILNYRYNWSFKRKWYLCESGFLSYPSSYWIFLLVKDNELIVSIIQNDIDIELIFSNLIRLYAWVIV